MAIPIGLAGATDPIVNAMVRILNVHFDEQHHVLVLGHKDTGTGTDVSVRFLASRVTEYVQVHVQSDAAGNGGAAYDASNYVSSSRTDCREDRQQDVTISRNGTDRYYLFLIPTFLQGDRSTYTKFDGVDGDDRMAFVDLGT